MVPIRALTTIEALSVAERQATRLLALSGVAEPPVPETVITRLPRIQVERIAPSPISGGAQWTQGRWLIILAGSEPLTRQRFSLAHEFKHVLDNPFIHLLYPDARLMSAEDRAEHICNYFAACLLMPRPWVKRAWAAKQNVPHLAWRFGVSHGAMSRRLTDLGLIEPVARCEVPALMAVKRAA
jgi:Zn-dependent peptidase ImmA (M78 family)